MTHNIHNMLLSLATCFYFVHHKPPVTGKTAVKTKSRMVARGSEITPSSTSQIWWSSILHQSPARLAKPCKITGPWFYFYCHALAKTLKGFGRCNTRTHTQKILCALLVHHSLVAVIQQIDQSILPCNTGGHFIHAVHTEKVPLLSY